MSNMVSYLGDDWWMWFILAAFGTFVATFGHYSNKRLRRSREEFNRLVEQSRKDLGI